MVVLTPKVITDILTNPLKGDSYASRSNAFLPIQPACVKSGGSGCGGVDSAEDWPFWVFPSGDLA